MNLKDKQKIFGSGGGEAKKQFRTDAATRNQIQRESCEGITNHHVEKWEFFSGMGKSLNLLSTEERAERDKTDLENIKKNKGLVKTFDNGIIKRYSYR